MPEILPEASEEVACKCKQCPVAVPLLDLYLNLNTCLLCEEITDLLDTICLF
mgnify:CR=1 FL=1